MYRKRLPAAYAPPKKRTSPLSIVPSIIGPCQENTAFCHWNKRSSEIGKSFHRTVRRKRKKSLMTGGNSVVLIPGTPSSVLMHDTCHHQLRHIGTWYRSGADRKRPRLAFCPTLSPRPSVV